MMDDSLIIGILIIVGIWFVVWLNNRVSSYKENKRLRELEKAREAENAVVQEALNGFDVYAEEEKILKLLKDTLPNGYRCSKSECEGILLKQSGSNLYVCSECGNIRHVVRV